MKKHLLFAVGLFVAIVAVVFVLALWQVNVPSPIRPSAMNSFGLGGGQSAATNFSPSLKMAVADRAEAVPAMAPAAPIVNVARKITKTGNLDILVESAETAVQNIQAIAESVNGYVGYSNLSEITPGVKAGSITIRVPADKFDQILSRIKELATRVESENVNANDVTEQFIDVNARLTTLKTEEAQYLAVLKKADKVEDILNVTNRLTEVRGQIESLQSQLKYLNSQVDLSTITVNLTAEKEVQILGINWRPLTVIKQAVRSLLGGLVNYADVLIATIIFLPVILLWLVTIGIVIWIIWRVVKFFKNRPKNNKRAKKTLAK